MTSNTQECKQFISDVQGHVLDVRYGRPNRHNPEGAAFSVSDEEKEQVRMLCQCVICADVVRFEPMISS